MIPFRSSAVSHAASASPSVTMERGAYRMRAPYPKVSVRSLQYPDQSSTRRNARTDYQSPSILALLVALLAFASMSSFAVAYYLFSSRWDTRQLVPTLVADKFQGVPVELRQDDPIHEQGETFLAYLPHSGFHNQRIAFENALVLSRMTNRTLLVPPVYLGSNPIHYLPFDVLYQELALANKVGLQHCARIVSPAPLPLECTDYFDHTQIPWDWLVDVSSLKHNQRLRQRWNFSEPWICDTLNISKSDILFIKDTVPYQHRFLDTRHDSPLNHKFSESIHVSDLIMSSKRLIHIGTLFGSSRLRLKNPTNTLVRGNIRELMGFTHPSLLVAASSIANSLGPFYIGVHLRLGDGDFKNNEKTHSRRAWWQVVHDILAYTEKEALGLEHNFLERSQDMPLSVYTRNDMPDCHSSLYTDPHHLQLNTPIFISTDVDKNNSALTGFWKTFPCLFFLSDFSANTAVLDELRNSLDGVSLKPVLLPFLDALVVGHAWKVVGTRNSTFSTFVEDVIWRKHHNLRIVERG
ncbi:hypothetical protein C0991_000773 [Blastosporella zonata]|nr:hypothetical protein C0991_000773 [Blastosporella zonata]